MEEIVLFIHRHGAEAPVEIGIMPTATAAELLAHPAVAAIVVELGVDAQDVHIFVEEGAAPLERHAPLNHSSARHGNRVHLSHCHEVEVEVYFVDRTAHHRFPPGARVRRVKDWAAQHFGLAENDAIEHVLHLHGSSVAPSPGAPLSGLLPARHCKLAFDLVPAKRVEG